MPDLNKYPYSLKRVLQSNQFENIADSNILNAYIPQDMPIPCIRDPRKTQASPDGAPRHPGYVRSERINQIFNYIGFIKRIHEQKYKAYLPLLFNELKRFLRVFEDIVYSSVLTISMDIYDEQTMGLQHFFNAYQKRQCEKKSWIEKIWKHQKIYLEQMDMYLQTLKTNGQVFDLGNDPLHEAIFNFCKEYFALKENRPPGDTDIRFVANCCLKAARDKTPKTIWSGDNHIRRILNAIYRESTLKKEFPQVYLRGSYSPRRFKVLFPH